MDEWLEELERVEARGCKHLLFDFCARTWSIVEPDTPWRPGFRHKIICDLLQAIYEDTVSNRWILNTPPGLSKELLVSVLCPKWKKWIVTLSVRRVKRNLSDQLVRKSPKSDCDLWLHEHYGLVVDSRRNRCR